MKFIVLDNQAVDEIVANRFLQSIEFEQGKVLLSLLKGEIRSAIITPAFVATRIGDGTFLTAHALSNSSRFLVIDEEQANLLNGQSESEALFSLQKLLRFAKKLWQGLSLTFAEKIISGSTKAVIFPYRYRPAPYRIVVEREPLAERLEKRGQNGNWLLAYKAGHEGGDALREIAGLTNFRKAYEALPELKRLLAEANTTGLPQSPSADIDQLQVMQLEPATGFGTTSFYRRYEDWLPLLTEQQARFVRTPVDRPARIEGAAGTGKTLALMLKAIHALRLKKDEQASCSIVFVTHSDATKRTIEEVASVIDSEGFVTADSKIHKQALKVCTLSELCADILKQSISESEFIDRDALESKELQLLYISEALELSITDDLPGHSKFLSEEFLEFMNTEDRWRIVTMMQHEISVIIKGRAAEDLDRYKKVPPLKYGMPISTDADKGFVYSVFRTYQMFLSDAGQFDTDDVVLTAIGQLDTPIWRRRRVRDGYDAVFIDETHLFNINELSLFHYFTKHEGPFPITYSIDRAQAVGDKGWSSDDISVSIGRDDNIDTSDDQFMKTVFRSSPEIVNLAFAILSSGATLFTNFDNPMQAASSGFTELEERLCADPSYHNVPNETALIEAAFDRADALHKELGCRRSDILIVSLSNEIVQNLTLHAEARNKPFLLLTKRGDALAVEAAREAAQWIIGHADFVGGLEFHGVVVVGVDGGRVPPSSGNDNFSSKSFLSYVSHNRLYVAVSRARYRVDFIGEKARGPSRIIVPAIEAGLISVVEL